MDTIYKPNIGDAHISCTYKCARRSILIVSSKWRALSIINDDVYVRVSEGEGEALDDLFASRPNVQVTTVESGDRRHTPL